MCESVPNFARITWPRTRAFSGFFVCPFWKLFMCIRMPNVKTIALRILEICFRVCDRMPRFVRVTWPRPRPFREKFVFVLFWFAEVEQCAKYQEFDVKLSCQMHRLVHVCGVPKIMFRMRRTCHVPWGYGSKITTYLESPTSNCLFTAQLSGGYGDD